MADPLEVDIQRENTLAFIDADPINVILKFNNHIELTDGGYKEGPEQTRGSQKFRLIPQGDVMPSVQTPDGVVLVPTYVLLGEHDCVMDRWDRFSFQGVDFIIVSPVRPDYRTDDNAYERKADVARR